jgi:hypothetical protein
MLKQIIKRVIILINFTIIATLLFIPIGCTGTANKLLTVVSVASGDITVSKGGSQAFLPVNVGMVLEARDIIQSGNDSSATITFFDGSTIELQASTQLQIASLKKTTSGTTTILLKQKIGDTISRVVKIADSKSRYEIETISATAAVRGSTMIVSVLPNGVTTVGNEEGKISIIAKGVEVAIPVGSHSIALPGQPPKEPEPGIKPATISSEIHFDSAADLFNKNGDQTFGENYLDIIKSQVSLTAGIYTVHIELSEHCPKQTSEPTTFIEWDILLDNDKNANTGIQWPLIGNDTGYDYMARMTLENTKYGQGLLKVSTGTWSEIDYIVAVYNYDKAGNIVDLYIPAESIGNPDSFNWIIAVRKYKQGDLANQPSVSDKSPDKGHYGFP